MVGCDYTARIEEQCILNDQHSIKNNDLLCRSTERQPITKWMQHERRSVEQ